MAKRTAVIDIGSNSARMVVFERTSRYGFFLLNETRSRVRISEGAYERGGELQEMAMARAQKALAEFLELAKNHKVRKILCVATSAVRDAPNRKTFLSRIEKRLGLKIKVIDGDKEAWLGGLAAVNLLPVENGITIDIGGGSTDMARIENRRIVETFSLKLGTVRIKELFFDKKRSIDEAKAYIEGVLASLPESFQSSLAIGIGGTIRALSKAIMEREQHAIERVHAFEYDLEDQRRFIEKIAHAKVTKLSGYGIKKERLDTIRPGALIFLSVLERIGAKHVITSGAGVREGVFLSDLLRNANHLFPANFNPSLRSLQDRFCSDTQTATAIARTAETIFDALREPLGLPGDTRRLLVIAAKLSRIGIRLNFYGFHKHSAYFVMNNLDYGFTHEEMILIATLIRFNQKKLPKSSFVKPYRKLLPDADTLAWLSFIVSLAQAIHTTGNHGRVKAAYQNETLSIETPFATYLADEKIKELHKPGSIAVKLRTVTQSSF